MCYLKQNLNRLPEEYLMANMEEKVCPNHPEDTAVSRCASCFKPLCAQCIIKSNGDDFCSDQCATNFSQSKEHFAEVTKRDKARKLKARIKKIIFLIIIAIIGYFGYKYWSDNKESINKKLESKSKQIQKDLDKMSEDK